MSDKAAALKAKAELADRVLARRRLLHYIKRRDPTYKDGWVHQDICARLERFSKQVIAGESPRLMLLMPPRLGKSRIASQEFPGWHLGHAPDHEFISASYNVALPMGFSRKVQASMEDPRYPFENVHLDPNNKSAETWGIQGRAGGYIAAGVGGGITGKGAHILVIDDPIKNAEEADSATIREALWNWYTSTAYTRLAPGGGVLVIQTCWHDDDLAGRLQQAMQAAEADDPDVDRFEIVKYPAIAEADEWMSLDTDDIVRVEWEGKNERDSIEAYLSDLHAQAVVRAAKSIDVSRHRLIRVKGEALHPARYDLRKLYKIKSVLPARFWNALYQQNPVPDDGNFFKREQFRQLDVPQKNLCNVFLTADFAITEKQHNDYTVIRVALQDEYDMLHYVDMQRMKSGDVRNIADAIVMLIKRWKTPNMRAGFENGQIFLALEPILREKMRKEKCIIPYETLQPVTDKQARATPLQARMQHGMAAFAKDAEWYTTVQQEYLRFPTGIHDDIVDADAWMARLVSNYAAPRPPKPKGQKSWKDKLPRSRDERGVGHMAS